MTSVKHKNKTSMMDLKEMSSWLLNVSRIFNKKNNKLRNILWFHHENLNLPVKTDYFQDSKFNCDHFLIVIYWFNLIYQFTVFELIKDTLR